MKKTRRILSLVLAFVLTFSVMSPMAAYAEGESGTANRVAVGVTTATGTMDLTQEGTTDWMHITSEQINRKAKPVAGEVTAECIDFMNASAASGRTFGQVTDQVWRYQTFSSKVTGPLSSLEVALIKRGEPSTLLAKLYKMGETHEELAAVSVPADQIASNEVLALDFGDVTVEAGAVYAVALSQEELSASSNYWWCNASTSFASGKIKEDGSWVQENTPASLRVVVGNPDEILTQEAVGIISFDTVGELKLASSFSDSAVAYSWSDGMPTESASNLTTGGVLSYENGTYTGAVEEEAGWKLSIPAADTIQTLTFVSGIWQASAEIGIYANGDLENPVYTNTELIAAGTSKLLKYTITVLPNTSIEVYGKLTNKTNVWGNMTLGGIALSRVETTPSVAVDVTTGTGSMNLTEVGTKDWVHFTSSQVNRKALPADGEVNAEIIDFMNAAATSGRTFGQETDQVWRYQTFSSKVTGKLTNLEVALLKKGSPSTLLAKLYKMGDTNEELASVAVPADQITSNEALALDFGDITIEAGATYAVAMSQEVLNNSTDQYWWCNTTTSFEAGKIKEDGTWVKENTPASLRVVIGDPDEIPEKEAVGIIDFELIGAMLMDSTMSDSAVTYAWSDGMPTESASGLKTGGVLNYDKGGMTGDIEEEAGWKLSIPAADTIQTLTFVSGIWQGSAEISIYINGDTENPIYTNAELTAGSSSNLLKYTVTVSPNTSIEVYGKMVSKAHAYGNMSLGGVALSESALEDGTDYIALLQEAVKTAEAWLNEEIDEYFINQLITALNSAKAALAREDLTNAEAYNEYVFLSAAIAAAGSSQINGNFANTYASKSTASFGWEGDQDAPIAWIDGTYRLRDNGNKIITFGVTNLEPKSVSWYNAEGYLPCFVSEYSKNGFDYKIENFADLVVIDGNQYEVAYSRMTCTNNNEETKLLPRVSTDLIPLNDAAKSVQAAEPGETVVREYCIGADRFGGNYAYPDQDVLAAQGSFDEHYAHMKEYWNDRLANIISIESIPEEYSELIDAYKAGYIYMLIIADGYELHVGENGYDRVYDHDVIGMLASLIESGHTEHFADYAQYILLNIQYPDAAWKFSWPFALYLQKTGDFDTVLNFWEDVGNTAGIQTNTHKIASERVVYDDTILDEDGNPARIMKITNAIDSNGYWVIDNWAALFGLTTYSYLCEQLYAETGEEKYKTEFDWAQAEYDSLLKSVEAVLASTMEKYDFEYIPISMVVPNELSARANVRDGNWAAQYLFGRWNWDGYLFGAEQDSWLLDLTDQTYDYIVEQKSTVFDSPYTMGGYPGFSSAYNAGYFSAALSGEKWRDGGIEAYLWMINNSMSGPYSWWESIDDPSDSALWDRDCTVSGGGSCQHMWGQSTATKVLIDSFFAEKADGTIIAGRGLPVEFNADGEEIKISNYICNGGKRIGFTMNTTDKTVIFTLTGDTLDHAVSLELLAFVDNIESVSDGLTYDAEKGAVLIPAGTTTVTVTMKQSMDEVIQTNEADEVLENAIKAGEGYDVEEYVTSTAMALTEAIATGKAVLESGTVEEKYAAAQAIQNAIDALVPLRTYEDALDLDTGRSHTKEPSFGEEVDERYRYATFKTGDKSIQLDGLTVYIAKNSAPFDDCLISIYTLAEDHYTLDTCLGTARMAASDIVSGAQTTFVFDESIQMEANTYYAVFFAMDNSNGVYGSYQYYADSFVSDDLYAVKIRGDGTIVNENAYNLGTPLMILHTMKTDKTALDQAVESTTASAEDLIAAAREVLLNPNATQEEIDAALNAILTESDILKTIELIDAIGEVTLDSGDAIDVARESYDSLGDDQKSRVYNYQTLLDAEHEYVVLLARSYAEEAQKAAEAAQKAYEEAKKAAEEAAAQIAEDKEAAEKAAQEAEEARKAAEEALSQTQAAQAAAEAAQAAAEAANREAAEKAAEAAREAARAAQEANQAAEAARQAAEAQEKAQAAQAAAEAAQTAAEAARSKAEEARQAAEEAAQSTAEDKEAAEKAAQEAENAQKAAEAAQQKAEAARTAAETAREAAEAANVEAAAKAAEAAAEAARAAQEATKAAEAAKEAAEAQEKAQVAQAAAEAAQAAAEEAKAKAEEAQRKAEEAADSAAEDKEAAEKAAREAEEARKAAEEAQKAAENARAAAELAKEGADAANKAAAESAALAAQYAQQVAEQYQEIAAMKAEMTDMLGQAQKAVEAAEAAALASAKYYAMFELANSGNTAQYSDHQLADYESAIAAARTAIEEAGTVSEVEAILTALRETVEAIDRSCPAGTFADVDLSRWYHESVDYMVTNGYMNGVDTTRFAPDQSVTRAQMVTILYRVAGEPGTEGMTNPFADVAEGTWYTDAVIWAAGQGVVQGVTENRFAPNANVTREQIVTILFRYAGAEKAAEKELTGFADADRVHSYAVDAMSWAVAKGLLVGISAGSETYLAPGATATRAQVAAIFMRDLTL